MFGLTDYEILRAERFGSRQSETAAVRCPYCERLLDTEYEDVFYDGEGQVFCDRRHYNKYYSVGGGNV